MAPDRGLQGRVAAMREAFDNEFARASAPPAVAASTRVLLIRVAGVRYAVRLADCAGLQRVPAIRPLPTRVPAFRGVAVADGVLVPVYHVASLLRLASRGGGERWLLVTAGQDQAGLLIDGLEGHGELAGEPQLDGDEPVIVTVNGIDCRLLNVPRIIEGVREVAGGGLLNGSNGG